MLKYETMDGTVLTGNTAKEIVTALRLSSFTGHNQTDEEYMHDAAERVRVISGFTAAVATDNAENFVAGCVQANFLKEIK